MNKLILKITSILTLLLVSLFCISNKTYAATSTSYDLALYFTFSSNMDIDEGFDLIKPFILYRDGTFCTANYTFNYENISGNQYKFSGTFPDGYTYSRYTTIQIIENASGTYVEAQMADPYRQSIYVKNLNEGKSTNDCLMECWKNRWVNVTYPTYSIQDTPTTNIYNHMTSFTTGAGVDEYLQYYAIIENVNYTPDEDNFDNATNNDTLLGGGSTTKPDDSTNNDTSNDDPSLDEPVVDDNEDNNTETPPNDDSSNNNQQNPEDSNNNQNNTIPTNEKDPLLIALICIGAILGIVLMSLIIKVIKTAILWLKR